MGVAIYARKSTESEDRQVQSLEDQLTVLRKLAASSGILVSEEIIEARSAKEPGTRPEFERMVAKIRSGEITGLLVWQMNRLSRNMVDGGVIAHLLQTGKLQFIHTADRSYRPNDSVLLLAIENGVSTEYIQGLSRNVKRGMEGKAMRGWQNGRAPFGYVNNLLTKEIEPDPERFELLKRGWEMLESGGYTVADVARELRALGLTGPSGRGPAHRSLIYSMFRKRFYCGDITFRGELSPGKHQPMVSRAAFDRVQEILGNSFKPRDPELKHPYAGLMRCGRCGCQITAETKVKRDRRGGIRRSYTYYHCTGARGCGKSGISGSVMDRILVQIHETFALHPVVDDYALLVIRRKLQAEGRVDEARIMATETEIGKLERRLSRLRTMRIEEELGADEYIAEKSQVTAQLETLQNSLHQAKTETEHDALEMEQRLGAISRCRSFQALSTYMKRGLIRALAESCFLTQEHLELRVHPIIRKIATFELPFVGSGSRESSDSFRIFPNWQGDSDVVRYLVHPCTEAPNVVTKLHEDQP